MDEDALTRCVLVCVDYRLRGALGLTSDSPEVFNNQKGIV